MVPEVVAGEAYAKIRYDRRVSSRRDARPALTVFGLLAADSELFDTLTRFWYQVPRTRTALGSRGTKLEHHNWSYSHFQEMRDRLEELVAAID